MMAEAAMYTPIRVQPRLVAVYRLLEEGETDKARAACRRVLRETPENPAATHLLGLICRADGELDAAEKYLRTSIELAPAVAEFRASLGSLLRDLGRAGDAERAWCEALALDPSNRTARSGLESLRGSR